MAATHEKTQKPSGHVPIEPPAGKLLLTIPEVMFLTGYSDRQIRTLIAEGRLKDCSMDRHVRIRRGDVLRLIDGKPPR